MEQNITLLMSDSHISLDRIKRKKAGLPTMNNAFEAFERSLSGIEPDRIIFLGDVSNYTDQQNPEIPEEEIISSYETFFRRLTLKSKEIWGVRGNTDPEYVLDVMKEYKIKNVDNSIQKIGPGLKAGFIGGSEFKNDSKKHYPYERKDEEVYAIFEDMLDQRINGLIMHSSPYCSPLSIFTDRNKKKFDDGQFKMLSEKLKKGNNIIKYILHGHNHNTAGWYKISNGILFRNVGCLYGGYHNFPGIYTILTSTPFKRGVKNDFKVINLNNFL